MTVADQLTTVRAELLDAQAAIRRLANASSEREWTTPPPAGGWSASECVVHLTMTTDAFLPRLEQARASSATDRHLPHHYRTGLMARFLVWFLQPGRGRTRTRPAFVPGRALPKAETVAEFDARQTRLLQWLDAASGERLDRLVIASPFAERVRYHAYAALQLIAVHQRRHLAQAERALAAVRQDHSEAGRRVER